MLDPPQDAWSIGVDKFLAILPAEHRAIFVAPANSDECMRLIEKAQLRNRKFDRLARILQPLIDPLRRFEGTIDILTQTNSTFASPVWGPLKAVLVIVNDRINTLQGLAVLLERLVDPLKRFQNYELLFQESRPLRQAIGALYCDLIEFCTRIVAHYCKTIFQKAFKSFDKDIEEVSDKIRHHWTEVDIVANAVNIEEAKTARRAQEMHRTLGLMKDINRWLCPSNTADDLVNHRSRYMSGSCDWLVSAPAFQILAHTEQCYTLRIQGRPGSGKSTAASFLVEHLVKKGNIVLYFFCSASDTEKRLPVQILRTLLWQLLQFDRNLYTLLVPWHQRSGRLVADSLVDVSSMFEAAIHGMSTKPIHIVVDALDECENPSSLLQTLFHALSVSACPIKPILFAREDPVLEKPLVVCNATLFMECNKKPVHDYVCERLLNMPIFQSPELRMQTAGNIAKASDGLWLFSRLVLDEIERAPSLTEVQRQINSIPSGLIQLYSSIITTKEAQQTELQIKMAQQLYLWLDTSEYVPEWLWKKSNGDSLEDDMITNLLRFASSSHDVFNPFETVQSLCAPLIRAGPLHTTSVHRLENLSHHPAFNLKFFHQTAKHYMAWSLKASLSQLPVSLQPRRLGHLHRGVTAAWYFSNSFDFKQSLGYLRERPRSGHFDCYFEMACGLWGCLKVQNLRRDLGVAEFHQVEDICNAMTWYLTTEQCLDFVEVSIILHFVERSTLLLDNVEDVLHICSSNEYCSTTHPAFAQFRDARQVFMADLAYILVSVWVKGDLPEHWTSKFAARPEGFDHRPLAKKALAMATRYQWLLWAPVATSTNCFLIGGRS